MPSNPFFTDSSDPVGKPHLVKPNRGAASEFFRLRSQLVAAFDAVHAAIGGGGSPTSYRVAFTDADLVAHMLTVVHGLGQQYVNYTIFNNNNHRVFSDTSTAVDANTLLLDFTSFGTLTGTWHVMVKS